MSNTYTGTLDPLSLTSQDAQVFPNDRQGTLVELSALPSGATVDNIFYFNSTTPGKYLKRVIDGPIRAVYCGVNPANTSAVNAANLQAALNHAGINTIVFDFSKASDIKIEGTITVPAGKVLSFEAGNRLTETATIEGGIIDAGDGTECFASTITVLPEGSTKSYYSAKWFGVKGNGVANDDAAIQKLFDFITNYTNRAKPIFFPRGTYMFNNSVLVYRWFGSNYTQCNIEIRGEMDARAGIQEPITIFKGTTALAKKFLLGIQRGRAIKISNIYFVGRYSLPYTFSEMQVYRNTPQQWKQTSPVEVADTQFSPHCGINIDPFGRTIPADNGYEGWSAYYRGTDGGGTSQVIIQGCRFQEFPVGLACSINGDTLQAEIIKVQECSFAANKAAYALGQSQTKENLMIDVRVWDRVRTIIECSEYGAGAGAPPYIMGMNIAGGVYQLINTTAPFSLQASKIFAESLFKIGRLASSANAHHIAQSDIDFPAGKNNWPSADYIVDGTVNFDSCTIRYYDDGLARIKFCPPNRSITIKGGTISRLPLTASASPSNDVKFIDLNGVKTYGENQTLLFGTDNAQLVGYGLLNNTPMCGNVKFFSGAGSEGQLFSSYEEVTYDTTAALETATVTVSENGNASVTLSNASLEKIRIGDYLISNRSSNITYWQMAELDNMPVLGRISAIAGNVVSLQGAAINIPIGNTSLPILVNYIRYFNAPLVGNITNGSNTITDCEFFQGHIPAVGRRLEHPYIPAGVYITAVSGNTITLSGNATGGQADASIVNGRPRNTLYLKFSPARSGIRGYLVEGSDIIVDRGTIYSQTTERYYVGKSVLSTTSTRPVEYYPTTGGFQRIDMATLRQGAGATDTNTTYFITDAGKDGQFIIDPTDTTSPDNSATVLVTVSGSVRFKRIITNNFYNARWFGKPNMYFSSIADCNTAINSAARFLSLTVLINDAGTIREYWYYNGITDSSLILKTQNDSDAFTIASDSSRSITGGTLMTYVLVNPSSALSGFKVGSASGTDDIISTQPVSAGVWKAFPVSYFIDVAASVYFGGITTSTQIRIVKLSL
ncbi:MAG: glycosyl hydrolase family 28-related protein [Pseudobacter sp.]|uniref:glycosyl hydrolase family 28-related protein n=1 Tax=Pseudobacter sp. TaxID=2045420 RepID=UPI003F816D64